jgi:hypothetical protein
LTLAAKTEFPADKVREAESAGTAGTVTWANAGGFLVTIVQPKLEMAVTAETAEGGAMVGTAAQ